MARIKIDLPKKNIGTVEIPVRITDVNYGIHVGNDAIVGIIHEARVSWLKQLNYSELNIEGASIIMSDLAVTYMNESYYGDILTIDIFIGEFSSAGFEIFYNIKTHNLSKNILSFSIPSYGPVLYSYTKVSSSNIVYV